ncbi:hypothetical protein [Enterobacter phage vB_ExiM_F5M1E]|nr:hypothetical protein [Enterobacter phage vB_ExiM_F1M1E]UNA03049.1 hypothetical protein [Enterobacter phage vB_ExiM_F2M1E]UNA03370.1 hypothetical protein [Enterobacter phage vB_ExiM_F4M1E]UNA03691.1 hypothetical protein [Enterobacter phage vB_ExiM_F5M1E]UNA04011.1 hypothetical protein [Pantoea phage vB_PdiM_F5M2A]
MTLCAPEGTQNNNRSNTFATLTHPGLRGVDLIL